MFRLEVLFLVFSLAFGEPLPGRIKLNRFFPHGRIVGGRETSIEEHPWQVSLQAYGFHFCGGSIISENVILTAGHCASFSADLVTIRAGTSFMESGGSVYKVAQVKRHERFEKTKKGIPLNDVAIFKLQTPIQLGKTSQPISLFDKDEKAVGGVFSTITGWGTTIENGDHPEVLQTADVPIVTKSECNKAYEDMFGGIPDGQICAAFPAGGKDSCQGDSGGPLVIGGRQAGIVSWGNGCARKGYPGVYTEIAAVREWIKEHADV